MCLQVCVLASDLLDSSYSYAFICTNVIMQ